MAKIPAMTLKSVSRLMPELNGKIFDVDISGSYVRFTEVNSYHTIKMVSVRKIIPYENGIYSATYRDGDVDLIEVKSILPTTNVKVPEVEVTDASTAADAIGCLIGEIMTALIK